ncbi:putative quinol monooxygenase [Caulobacter sp. KR2-114]|uniref:putative quinol monooxygenase n=1 Tax=Caulobacter sp. KR2-114 TaxID=3400912 RepID=UPI003BFA913B
MSNETKSRIAPEDHRRMTTQAKIIAILTAKPAKAAQLEALLRDLGRASRAEPGNVRWDIWRDRDDPNRFVLDELYRDAAAVDAHRAAPYFQDYLSRVGALAERLAIVGHPVDVT